MRSAAEWRIRITLRCGISKDLAREKARRASYRQIRKGAFVIRIISVTIVITGLLFAGLALTQAPPAQAPAANAEGAAVFQRECASCHINPPADSRAPTRESLGGRTADAIVAALTDGAMRLQGSRLSVAERRSVAAFLTAATTQRPSAIVAAEAASLCKSAPQRTSDPNVGPNWNGWGGTVTNTRFQSA